MHTNIQVLERNQTAMETTINRVKENDAILQCTKPALNSNLKTSQNSALVSSFGKTKQTRNSSSPPKQGKLKQTTKINDETKGMHKHIQHLKQNQAPMETIKDNDAMIQCKKPALNFNLKTEQ